MGNKKGIKILIVVLLVIIALAGGVLAYKFYQDSQKPKEATAEKESKKVEAKEPQIFKGTDRPIAVMIDNHSDAWPQGGLNDAYIVYEIIVEGGETRLMPIFKGQDIEKIGPVRSSRHYFLDYALENDAIYVHYGWSPQAEKDITKLNVNNINGITESESDFWRVKDKKAPHNVATSTSKLLEISKNKKYNTTSNTKSVLKYIADDFDLADKYEKYSVENNQNTSNTTALDSNVSTVIGANSITIPHSKSHKVKYQYNSETKRYTRYARGKVQTDWTTKEDITTKNIIVEFIDNVELNDGENKDRQDLKNIGTFDGYYITNGKAIKIKCTKSSRTEKTVYKDLVGNEIEINDGNTWINICPKDAEVEFE